MIKNSKVYDVLKYVQRIALPALSALILSLGNIFIWEDSVTVAGVIAALDLFLGSLLETENKRWHNENAN